MGAVFLYLVCGPDAGGGGYPLPGVDPGVDPDGGTVGTAGAELNEDVENGHMS